MAHVPVELRASGSADAAVVAPAPTLPSPRPPTAPPAFHVMTKPTGPICNLDCTYCFFLSKEALYPGDRFRMGRDVMEAYVRQLLEAHDAPEVTVAWQGGEPTLMGVEFFRDAMELAESLARPGQTLLHTVQTNGTLLTDEWGALLAEHDVLVGISIDGPAELHDSYRVDKRGEATHHKVLRGLEVLQRHGVDWNVLCTVNAANQDHPLEVYRYLRDELGAEFIQLIPIVERETVDGVPVGDLTDRSVDPEAWGRFLVTIFDEWVVRDVGRIFVPHFDSALAAWLDLPSPLCIFGETCGDALALEHNGDLYSCDHFVEPDHLLGNITETHMLELVASPQQRAFGTAKRDTLPQQCRDCDVLFACRGECPKNRLATTADGEDGLNHLCAGYLAFFHHVTGPMELMADLVRRDRAPAEIVDLFRRARRNDPCPCGSGRKAKACHPAP